MIRTLNEQQVLKKLDIPDFRYMTKDKIISFANMMPQMDRAVAEKAIEQFPQFADMALEVLKEYREILEKSADANSSSNKQCMDIYDKIISSLQGCLENENLSFDEKKYYIEQMKEIADKAAKKDSENKHFNWGLAALGTVAIATVVGVAASVLGVKVDFHSPDKIS